jgi:hypothetical protein
LRKSTAHTFSLSFGKKLKNTTNDNNKKSHTGYFLVNEIKQIKTPTYRKKFNRKSKQNAWLHMIQTQFCVTAECRECGDVDNTLSTGKQQLKENRQQQAKLKKNTQRDRRN